METPPTSLNELACHCYTPVVISKSFQPHHGSIAIKGKVIRECVLPRNCESHLHFRANGEGSCTVNKGTAGAAINNFVRMYDRYLALDKARVVWSTPRQKELMYIELLRAYLSLLRCL